MSLHPTNTFRAVRRVWRRLIIPALCEYVAIHNCSPAFPDDHNPSETDRAVELLTSWAEQQPVPGLKVQVLRQPNRTPLIFMEVPGTAPGNVLMYGHMDKQPPLTEKWREGLKPYEAVIEGDKLFGRGAADDGYALFASLTALRVLAEQGVPYARCVIIIEASEESGSPDLPAYVAELEDRIGQPDLVVCLDSGCGDYERFCLTTSLRGVIVGDLRIAVLEEGAHSGHASGIVPSSFDILCHLLARLRDDLSGRVLLESLRTTIPSDRIDQARNVARMLGARVFEEFSFASGAGPLSQDPFHLLVNNTWDPRLSVTGIEGLPPLGSAGNVLLPSIAVKLSMRIPPLINPNVAAEAIREVLEAEPPFGAQISFVAEKRSPGWNAPTLEGWLERSVNEASQTYFEEEPMMWGQGGTIPFMQMLSEEFPQAQFVVTGLLGPGSNAHAPNEFLHVPTGEKLTACVAHIIAEHAVR